MKKSKPVKRIVKSPGGAFITFEGIDGSGKTTQIELLEGYINSLGLETVFTREPGGTQIGDSIRQMLLSSEHAGISARAESLLFMASRAELVEKVILPALKKNKVVICDRFFDSTIAYQGIARGLGRDDIYEMSLWATCGLVPDATFLLSLSAAEGEKRIDVQIKKRDRIEQEKLDFKEKIQDGYLEIAGIFKDRFTVIDAGLEIEEITEIIKRHTDVLLKKKGLV
jgi:dTMP kinase